MSEKQEIIQKMIEMQKTFIDYEQKNGVSGRDYYYAPEGNLLATYNQEYMAMADKLVDLAHKEKGSIRT